MSVRNLLLIEYGMQSHKSHYFLFRYHLGTKDEPEIVKFLMVCYHDLSEIKKRRKEQEKKNRGSKKHLRKSFLVRVRKFLKRH